MSQRNETIRIVLGYLFAFFVVGLCFLFLYEAFLNPATASLPDTVSGIIVGSVLSLATGAATFVFGQALMQSAARSASTATQAGVNAALTQPPGQPTVTVTEGPPQTTTITPAPDPEAPVEEGLG